MTPLEKLVTKLRKRKQEATRLKNKAEKQLQEFRSIERRSSSSLNTIDKKIESEKEDATDVTETLTQKNAQIESVGRLITLANERLDREKDAVTQTEQEIEFASTPEEKSYAEARLRAIKDRITELEFEIKNREKTAKKIANDISKFNDVKSKITTKIQKQSKSKPSLKATLVSSHKEASRLTKELERRTRAEEAAKNALDKATKKLHEFLAKKRTSKRPAPKKAKRPAPKKATKTKPRR